MDLFRRASGRAGGLPGLPRQLQRADRSAARQRAKPERAARKGLGMNGEPVFTRKLFIGWIAGAIALFALSLFLMGSGEQSGPDSTGASTFSRSAIGHAGIAEVLTRLGIPVVKSRYNSLEKLSDDGLLVIAEPRAARQSEEELRTLLKADVVLLVLPKWIGEPSKQTQGWVRRVAERFPSDPQWALHLVAPRGEVVRESGDVTFTTNALGLTPSLVTPVQLMRGQGLRALIAGDRGMLLGEVTDQAVTRGRTIWVLSDPDVI